MDALGLIRDLVPEKRQGGIAGAGGVLYAKLRTSALFRLITSIWAHRNGGIKRRHRLLLEGM